MGIIYFKQNMCKTGIVRGLGALLALLGLITIVMGITITTGSSWLHDLIEAEETAPGAGTTSAEQKVFAENVAGLGSLLEMFIYIFGVYMLIQGALAVQGCGKKCQGNCMCVTLFQIFQIVLFALTLIMALIPAGMYFLGEDDLDWFCNTSADAMET